MLVTDEIKKYCTFIEVLFFYNLKFISLVLSCPINLKDVKRL